MKAFLFPGQGSQRVGMADELRQIDKDDTNAFLRMADKVLGYSLSEIMTTGTLKELKQTKVTQPAVYVYSVIRSRVSRYFTPDMVAGHSLGEISALAATRSIKFVEGLRLVQERALAMQDACDAVPSGMAAVLGADDAIVEAVCNSIDEEVIVAANYNCPGQLVISGSLKGIEIAKEKLMDAGARRVLPLRVNGAFHSPLMAPAKERLERAINNITFKKPNCPIYQNIDAKPSQDPEEIKDKLIQQLTRPVRWTQTIENMVEDGANAFVEVGSAPVLSNMVKKINNRLFADLIK